MAEQNKKTDQQKEIREEVKRIVDRHLQMILSASDDVGWEGPTMIERMILYGGKPPESSGFHAVDKMPDRILRVIDWPAKHRVSRRLMLQLSEAQRMALYIDRLYRHRHKPDSDTERQTRHDIYWSDAKCAAKLDITPNAFRSRISQGYRALEALIAPAVEQVSDAA